MKIFEFKGGSLIDQVSKTVGTIGANSKFVKAERGLAIYGKTNDDRSNRILWDVDTSASEFTFVVAGKYRANDSSFSGFLTNNNDDNNGFSIIVQGSGVLRTFLGYGTGNAYYNPPTSVTLKEGEEFFIVISYKNDSLTFYYNGVDKGTTSTETISFGSNNKTAVNVFYTTADSLGHCGHTYFARIYNHELTTKEKNDLYKQFLNSYGTEEQKMNFEYPKPTDLSYEDGLVVAYNMIPSNGTIVDISGNGHNGTITGALSTKDGLKFDGVDDYVDYGNAFTIAGAFSLDLRIRFDNSDANKYILGYPDNTYRVYFLNTLLYVAYAGSLYGILHGWTLVVGQKYTLSIYSDGVNGFKAYLNGISSVNTGEVCPGIGFRYVSRHGGNYSANTIEQLKLVNYCKTPAQAAAYHNSFVKPALIETFKDSGVGETHPKGWTEVSGSGEIKEETTGNSLVKLGDKYWEQGTAGDRVIQSKQAYGTWEFSVYKGGASNNDFYNFINDSKVGGLNLSNGYHINIDDNERLILRKNSVGSFDSLGYTATSYISNNTWYRIKVARLKSEGVFKDIPILNQSTLENSSGALVSNFTAKDNTGFIAINDSGNNGYCGTADEIPYVNGAKYLVEFNAKLNSSTGIRARAFSTDAGGSMSDDLVPIEGFNSSIITATSTTTGRLQFFKDGEYNIEVSGLTIRRIYPADTFAVFIKGGGFGDTWTLADTTGGSGSIPVTDATYTTSEFFVVEADAGDAITNIKLTDGVIQ